jgi:glycosyltransferase involved in cell wall biosynthesis
MDLLLASTLDSSQPFGPFTRPFYLGLYLAQQFELCQIGLDCSAIDYAPAISVGSRSLKTYIATLEQAIARHRPQLIYAQETLPAIAALLAVGRTRGPKPRLVFDFHTLSAFEYWSQLPVAVNKGQQLKQLIKTYLAQGLLVLANRPIIAAGRATVELIPKLYGRKSPQHYNVGNGIPEDLIRINPADYADCYRDLRPAKIVSVIAPKATDYDFPSNEMSVEQTLEVAGQLRDRPDIQFVIIGRSAPSGGATLPSNVRFTGFLPSRQDFLAHLAHSDVGLLPFPQAAVAGGARNKALDYFAAGKVVVSTPEGLRGLEMFQPHSCLTGYGSQAIAQTLIATCDNFEQSQASAQAGHQLVSQQYSWRAMANQVADILSSQLPTQPLVLRPTVA